MLLIDAPTLDVVGYSDADYKSYVDGKKYTTGHILIMAKGTISWWIAQQSITASLTMKEKYVAIMRQLVI